MIAPPSVDDFLEGLTGPAPGSAGSERVVAKAVREYCGAVHAHLRDHRREIGGGLALNELHSDLMDRLVRRLFALAEESYFSESGEPPSALCALAVGGYARREMSVYSDIDLLFLHEGKITPYVASVAEKIQYWLWDAQLSVGCATRTIDETFRLASNDSTVRTALMETRFLVGSGALFQAFSDVRRQSLFGAPDRFIEEQAEALRARHTQFGDSLYLLQPNVKEGAGGLRDYHVAYWAMQATQPHARGRENFLYLGLLTDIELHELTRALDFLWRVRNELHLISGRKGDQMSFELQEQIAHSLGYEEAAGSRDLPVERFMGDYYRHARAISNYSSLVIEQCLGRVRRVRRPKPPKEVEDGFRIRLGQLEIPHVRLLRERPLRLLTAFAVAQAHDVPLTRKARRLIRENLSRIDDDFRRSPSAREVFLGILGSDHRVMRTLAAMNEAGVMAALLPEWEHIVCRWQHVMYHTYTVDVHSIFLVEELRWLWRGKYGKPFPDLTDLMHEVDDLPVLYLGCLLHDIGKGFGTDHSTRGAERGRACVERLGLSADRCDRVVFLVRHHLLMSHLAQRRDLSDPKLILEFARLVGDRVNLRNLYLLTFADVRASSSSAWTDWKGRLLRELFERTSDLLEAGADDPGAAIEIIDRRVEFRREAAAAELRDLDVSEEHIEVYFESMPRRYFSAHPPREIARHAQVLLALDDERVVSTAVRDLPGGFSEFILCARDVHGLYANAAGVLTAHNLNILGSHVYSTRSGLALEIYRVATPPGGEAERRLAWAAVDRSFEEVLSGRLEVSALLERRGRPVGIAEAPRRKPVTVSISNQESDFYTIVDVTANDRLGLLHDLTRTIAEHDFEIYISKAATIMDQVTDTFYLKDRAGGKLRDAEAIERLRTDLLEAAEVPEIPDGG